MGNALNAIPDLFGSKELAFQNQSLDNKQHLIPTAINLKDKDAWDVHMDTFLIQRTDVFSQILIVKLLIEILEHA